MSDYAAIAKTNWMRLAPSQYEALENPEAFFQNLASHAEDQIDQLQLSLEGQDSPSEDFLAKWGRLNAAKQQAEEIVISEVLTPPKDQWETDPQDESETPDPMWTAINQRIAQLEQEADQRPE
jgi:hypothetical protein